MSETITLSMVQAARQAADDAQNEFQRIGQAFALQECPHAVGDTVQKNELGNAFPAVIEEIYAIKDWSNNIGWGAKYRLLTSAGKERKHRATGKHHHTFKD